jgi:hypothetical protein
VKGRDFAQAATAFELGVAAGDARCMDYLGYLYLEGLGRQRNPQKAFGYFQRAANLGNDQACRNLGNMYFYGRDVDCDPALASTWWRKSTELGGDPRPAFSLAQLLYLGDGVDRNPELAAKFWKRAEELGGSNPSWKWVSDDAAVALAVVEASGQAQPAPSDSLKALANGGHVTAQGTLKFFELASSDAKTLVKDVPFIHQAHNFCALASSTILLRLDGVQVSQFDVAQKRNHNRWGEGSHWKEMVAVAGRLGKSWRIVAFPNTASGYLKAKSLVLEELKSGRPAIIDILEDKSSRSAHSIVICGFDPKTSEFLARNPALAFPGYQVFSEERMKTIWRSRGFIPGNNTLKRPMIVVDSRSS